MTMTRLLVTLPALLASVAMACSPPPGSPMGPFFYTWPGFPLPSDVVRTTTSHPDLLVGSLTIWERAEPDSDFSKPRLVNVTIDTATGDVTPGWPENVVFTESPTLLDDPSAGYEMLLNDTIVTMSNTSAQISFPLAFPPGYVLLSDPVDSSGPYFFVPGGANADSLWVVYAARLDCTAEDTTTAVNDTTSSSSAACVACASSVCIDSFVAIVDLTASSVQYQSFTSSRGVSLFEPGPSNSVASVWDGIQVANVGALDSCGGTGYLYYGGLVQGQAAIVQAQLFDPGLLTAMAPDRGEDQLWAWTVSQRESDDFSSMERSVEEFVLRKFDMLTGETLIALPMNLDAVGGMASNATTGGRVDTGIPPEVTAQPAAPMLGSGVPTALPVMETEAPAGVRSLPPAPTAAVITTLAPTEALVVATTEPPAITQVSSIPPAPTESVVETTTEPPVLAEEPTITQGSSLPPAPTSPPPVGDVMRTATNVPVEMGTGLPASTAIPATTTAPPVVEPVPTEPPTETVLPAATAIPVTTTAPPMPSPTEPPVMAETVPPEGTATPVPAVSTTAEPGPTPTNDDPAFPFPTFPLVWIAPTPATTDDEEPTMLTPPSSVPPVFAVRLWNPSSWDISTSISTSDGDLTPSPVAAVETGDDRSVDTTSVPSSPIPGTNGLVTSMMTKNENGTDVPVVTTPGDDDGVQETPDGGFVPTESLVFTLAPVDGGGSTPSPVPVDAIVGVTAAPVAGVMEAGGGFVPTEPLIFTESPVVEGGAGFVPTEGRFVTQAPAAGFMEVDGEFVPTVAPIEGVMEAGGGFVPTEPLIFTESPVVEGGGGFVPTEGRVVTQAPVAGVMEVDGEFVPTVAPIEGVMESGGGFVPTEPLIFTESPVVEGGGGFVPTEGRVVTQAPVAGVMEAEGGFVPTESIVFTEAPVVVSSNTVGGDDPAATVGILMTSAPVTAAPASGAVDIPGSDPAISTTFMGAPVSVAPVASPVLGQVDDRTATTGAPITSLTTGDSSNSALCSAHPACAGLLQPESACCPSVLGFEFACCGMDGTDATTPEPSAILPSCAENPRCAAMGLSDGPCCPTDDLEYLDCCSVLPDECGDASSSCIVLATDEFMREIISSNPLTSGNGTGTTAPVAVDPSARVESSAPRESMVFTAPPVTTAPVNTITPSPTMATTQTSSRLGAPLPSAMPLSSSTQQGSSSTMCSAHPACTGVLSPDSECCPTVLGFNFECCETAATEQAILPSCAENPRCTAMGLTEGPCCPSADGAYLDCCSVLPDACAIGDSSCVFVSTDEFIREMSGQGVVGGTTGEEMGTQTMPPTVAPAPIDPAVCSSHPACEGVLLPDSECCPTVLGFHFACCSNIEVQEPLLSCTDNPGCTAMGLSDGPCCPTADGAYLDCCTVVPDDCAASSNSALCSIMPTDQFLRELLDKAESATAGSQEPSSGSRHRHWSLVVAVLAYVGYMLR